MVQLILVIFGLFNMANQYRQAVLTNQTQGVRYLYLHPNGYYYDFPPQIPEYQNQGQAALPTPYGSQGGSWGYHYGQSPQAYAYPQGY